MIFDFLKLLFSFRMMPYTVPLFVMLLYWIFFLLGVAGDSDAGVDAAADSAVDGAVDGALDGAVDGALDGVADAALDGAVDGALDGAVDAALDGTVDGALDGAVDGALDGAADAALDGAADAALDGAVDGALDGAADVAVDGAADAAVDGVADAAAESASESVTASLLKSVSGLETAGVMATADAVTEKTAKPKPELFANRRKKNLLGRTLSYLHIGEIPATIVFSILISINWLLGYLGIIWISNERFVLNFPWTEGIIRFVVTAVAAILLGGLVCRPLSRIFGLATVHVNEHLIGKPCRIKSSTVTGNFGEGELTIDGSYIIISLRTKDKKLWHEGELATIVGYDEEKNVYYI